MSGLTTPAPEVPRDRYKRPLITPPGGGKAVPYTRCTTYIDGIDDKYNLQQWEKRMVAIGLSQRPGLMLSVSAHVNDKKKLDEICAEAKEAAAASEKATIGTALHSLTEQLDRGLDIGVIPDAYRADLTAYQEATKGFVATHIEQLTVLDPLQIAGTPDRIVKFQGKTYIADVKTGSIDYGSLKIAMQMAVYARSQTYDHVTNTRGAHGADNKRALIIHLPAGEGKCDLYFVDIEQGWHAVTTAKHVREWRKRKFNDLCERVQPADLLAQKGPEHAAPDVPALIKRAGSLDALTALWFEHQDVWTAEHTQLAAECKAAILKDVELDAARGAA